MIDDESERRDFVIATLVQYETRLVRYCTRLLHGNEDEARDVVQHAFLKLCEQPIDEVQIRAGPWLFRVCRNRVIDRFRRGTRTQQVSDHELDCLDLRQADPTKLAESADLMVFVQQLIGTLPPSQQEVIDLWSHGLGHHEIAEVVDKSVGAVRASLHRTMKQLKSNPRIRQWLAESSANDLPRSTDVSSDRMTQSGSTNARSAR